jgi:hypothetical protein
MSTSEILEKLEQKLDSFPDAQVVAEHGDVATGWNVKSKVIDVIVEHGQIVLVTDASE